MLSGQAIRLMGLTLACRHGVASWILKSNLALNNTARLKCPQPDRINLL